MNWPNDADGDVLRRMAAKGFDFRKPCAIEFNVDFEEWPPSEEAIGALRKRYPSTTCYPPTDEDPGYIQLQVFQPLTYDLVTSIQSEVTELVAPYGGICESWGVLHG